mmetsp:Transcript_20648/g.44312  ORF Transcript_20648/g.44312 Transcript_20648/m.44312 type:complete len:398 (+) Transcript_20648:448-1641(+)
MLFHSSCDMFRFSSSSHMGMERFASCSRGRSFEQRSAKRGGGGRSFVMESNGVEVERAMPPPMAEAGTEGRGLAAPPPPPMLTSATTAAVRGTSLRGTRCSVRHPSEEDGAAAAVDDGAGPGLDEGPVGIVAMSTTVRPRPAVGPRHLREASERSGRGAEVSASLEQWTYRLPSGSKLSVLSRQKSEYSCTNFRKGRSIAFREHPGDRSSDRNFFHCFSSLSSSVIRSFASESNESGYWAALSRSSLPNSFNVTGRAHPVRAGTSFRTVDGATPSAMARLRFLSITASDRGIFAAGAATPSGLLPAAAANCVRSSGLKKLSFDISARRCASSLAFRCRSTSLGSVFLTSLDILLRLFGAAPVGGKGVDFLPTALSVVARAGPAPDREGKFPSRTRAS